MRKFVVSDLHGEGKIYSSIISYLENISLVEPVELYINGDLIDRGPDSLEMFEDVIYRVEHPTNLRVHYLAGNHEYMMWQALKRKKPNKNISLLSNWVMNGGGDIIYYLEPEMLEKKTKEYLDFLGDLKIYHLFDECIQNNQILLVHAKAPKEVYKDCHMKISDNNYAVHKAVWTRYNSDFPFFNRVGHKDYFTIIGHTPILSSAGFEYNLRDNRLNIDGASAAYTIGMYSHDHIPLVEIKDNSLEILIFNHDNNIINGYFFDDEIAKMNSNELNMRKIFLERSILKYKSTYQKAK